MKKIIGYSLIFVGLIGGASGGANLMFSKNTGVGRIGESVGVLIFTVVLVVPGVFLVNGARDKEGKN